MAALRLTMVALTWLVTMALPASALVDVRIGSCTIVVTSPGVLTASADLRTLSSTNPGGRAARASVTTLINGSFPHLTCSLVAQVNCFHVTFVPPTNFSSAPPNSDANVVFTGQVLPQGNASLLNLLSAIILNGTQTIDLALTATKTSGSFSAGTYQAIPTIRCE
ncbi:hypothetical protein [Aureimonas sp. AU22]|uniref:hypothetical protein n=1 Tax=Aureimonas sp. AU22 TaxID=1638162 RepID=UPI000784CA73|nr:hypothetical protein [Aureimonas sp. AU22]